MRGVAYATIEIIVLIVLAAIIGLLIGWILRKFLYDVDLGALEARIAAAERARRAAEGGAASAREQVEALTGRLEASERATVDAEQRMASLAGDLDGAREQVEALTGRLEASERATVVATKQVTSLTADLDAALQDAGTKEAAIGRLEAELAGVGALEARADAGAARIAELEVLVVEKAGDADRIAQLEEALRGARDEQAARIAELQARDVRIAQLEAAARRVTSAPASGPEAPSKDEAVAAMAAIASRTAGGGPRVDDDLKKIHGVGPKLERLLKRMGITSFAQVARFEAGDIATVTAALDAFPGRIERDDWMASAAEEHEKKYGVPVPGT
jgi:predicted flap endonuclease-1-like 5' DNA nuclease